MQLLAALLLLAAGQVYSEYIPTGIFFDHPELHDFKLNATNSKKHFESDDGQVKFHYEVEHHPRATYVELDALLPDLSSPPDLSDDKDTLTLTFSSSEKAEAYFKDILSNHSPEVNHFLITGHHIVDEASASTLKKTMSNPILDSSSITFSNLSKASYSDCFKEAKIHFSTKKYPENHFTQRKLDVTKQTDRRKLSKRTTSPNSLRSSARRTNWFTDACTDVWNTVVDVAEEVESVVETVINVVVSLASGHYESHETLQGPEFAWNTQDGEKSDGPTKIDDVFTCDDCYMYAGVAFQFDLIINDYGLDLASLIVEGKMVLQVKLAADISSQYEVSNEVQAAEIEMDPIKFAVSGVPFVLDTKVPIMLGYDTKFDPKAQFSLDVRFEGDVSYGFKYSYDKGFQSISESNFDHRGDITDVNVPNTLTQTIYIKPVLVMTVDHIGGPDVGVKAYMEYIVDGGNYSPDNFQDPCPNDPKLTFNAGLQATIGGHIDIEVAGETLFKKDYDSVAVFSIKKPILSACLMSYNEVENDSPNLLEHGSAEAEKSVLRVLHPSGKVWDAGDIDNTWNDGSVYGTTWYGTLTRNDDDDYHRSSCDNFPEFRTLTLQNIGVTKTGSGDMIDLVVVSSDAQDASTSASGNSDYCTQYSSWILSCYGEARYGGSFIFKPIETPNNLVDYVGFTAMDSYGNPNPDDSSCLNSASIRAGYSGDFSANYETLTMFDSLGCSKIELHRVHEDTTEWKIRQKMSVTSLEE
ncbi:hypothetical protein TrST_g9741 [Triparma strigata]|uniref:Uncharacterized protein n=1 Tax=Triparma strigata TaxID=1606541 RepID=A0A9W7B9J6_9STRA|nr:hypothetical protein TrST_g9741 [Triparma strigata]